MADDDIIAAAKSLIAEHGEDAAFMKSCAEMERCAFTGDMVGMERMADIMLAIATLGESADDRTVH